VVMRYAKDRVVDSESANQTSSTTGGSIEFHNDEAFHTFNTSGTFTAGVDMNVDVLIVAGGGGGGYDSGGGGGAGGLVFLSNHPVTSGQAYQVWIGAGGSGAASQVQGSNGQNSIFGTSNTSAYYTEGGGGGGSAHPGTNDNGASGGSGGGASGSGPDGNPGAANSAIFQGYPGGDGYTAGSVYGAGGGGGAGEKGGDGWSLQAGDGGNGLSFVTSSKRKTYAGGGGGSAWRTDQLNQQGKGGAGGGGPGGFYNANPGLAGFPGFEHNSNNGLTNRGGGGGGGQHGPGDNLASGANGGSGVVVIKYKKFGASFSSTTDFVIN